MFNTFQMNSEMMLGLKADRCCTTWPGTCSSSSAHTRKGRFVPEMRHTKQTALVHPRLESQLRAVQPTKNVNLPCRLPGN